MMAAVLRVVSQVISFVCLGLSGLLFFKARLPAQNLTLGILKIMATTLSPHMAAAGALGAVLALVTGAPWAAGAGLVAALLFTRYVWRATRVHMGMDHAFGKDWQKHIPDERLAGSLKHRWSVRLPCTPEPKCERDIVFAIVPGSSRELLCDVWQPPESVVPSGLAFIYLHGGGWHFTDKDFGTRPFFHHLTAQGHVVMDVANRLCPEVDIRGQVHDVKRAIAWMRQNGMAYGVTPECVVLGGGSSGGNIALLAAYTPDHPALTPPDARDTDLSVRGVVSYYGPTDLRAYHRHAGVINPDDERAVEFFYRLSKVRTTTHSEMMMNMAGGLPDQVPEMYDLLSPVTHVGPHCPPTLLLQGGHDSMTSPVAVRELYDKLVESDVPAIHVEFPQTPHAFDVALHFLGMGLASQASPAAQAALYDVDRFLALLAGRPIS